jgi:arginine decarboxylase
MYDWHKRTGRAYVTSGTGYGKTELSAFDAAELNANIISTNAVKVSSFVPPNWQIVKSKEELGRFTDDGAFLPMAYAYAVSNKGSVAASLLIGINKDTTKASIIVEHADVNVTTEQSLEQSEICIQEAFGSRGWEINRFEKLTVEAVSRDSLYACALVAVVFLVD